MVAKPFLSNCQKNSNLFADVFVMRDLFEQPFHMFKPEERGILPLTGSALPLAAWSGSARDAPPCFYIKPTNMSKSTVVS